MASARESAFFFSKSPGEGKETILDKAASPGHRGNRGHCERREPPELSTVERKSAKKKRHHRRKSNKKHPPLDRDRDSLPSQSDDGATQLVQTAKESKAKSRRRRYNQGTGKGHAKTQVRSKRGIVLRPTKVPLLNAPRNSTQFIIADHESTDHLLSNETRTARKDRTRRTSADNNGSCAFVEEAGEGENDGNASTNTTGGSSQPAASALVRGDDEDTFWHYSERDFQSVYESTHQEVVASWTREELVDGICSLERRVKELVNRLSRFDSEIYLQHLEEQLQKVSEENHALVTLAKTKGIEWTRDATEGAMEVEADT